MKEHIVDEIKLPADAADRKIFARTAPAYWWAGLSVIPIRQGDKRPALPAKNDAKGYPAWTEYCRRLPEVEDRETWLKVYGDCGIGLALGPVSGVVVIDVDTVDSDQIAAIERVLPPSPWRRVGSKGWAAAYRYSGVKSFKIKDNNEATVVEHLAEGNQVVLPPSIHPRTGRPYTANCELPDVLGQLEELPADVEARLRSALGLDRGAQRSRVAVKAAPVDREGLVIGTDAVEMYGILLPGRCGAGGRDDTCTRIVGHLARGVVAGRWNLWSAEAALEAWFSAAVEQPLGDELLWDKWPVLLWKFVAASADEAGGRAGFGWREGLTDQELMVRGLDHVREGDPVGWIARNYIYVAREDAFVEKERGIACPSAELMRRFKHLLPEGAAMLRDDAARDFVRMKAGGDLITADYAALRPEMALGLARDEAGRAIWNTWKGWSVAPRSGGDVGPWLDLLRRMFPVDWEREVLCDWLAHVVQRPGDRISWAAVLISEAKGTGKGTLGGVLLKLFGPGGVTVSNAALSGRFTEWLADKCFVFVDETFGPDRVEVREKLKTWIAGPETFGHEAKGRGIVQMPQRASFLIASNHEDFLPLEHDDRRWFIPELADKVMTEAEWTRFHSWLDANLGVVLDWLLSRPIPASFNAKGRAPVTEKWLRIGRQGSSLAGKYVAWGLAEGRGPFGRDVTTLDAVMDFLGRYGVKVTSPDALGKELARLGCQKVGRYRIGGAKTYVWAVRKHDQWAGAPVEAIRAELSRAVSSAEVETAEASAALATRLGSGVAIH